MIGFITGEDLLTTSELTSSTDSDFVSITTSQGEDETGNVSRSDVVKDLSELSTRFSNC